MGPLYQLHPCDGNESYQHRLIKAFDSVTYKSDVTIHCLNKTQVKTNKLSLFFSSKLFSKIIGNSEINQFQDLDVLCPDFDSRSMAKVIELVNTGATKLSINDETVYKEMIEIFQCLQINIQFKEKTFSKSPVIKPTPIEVAQNNSLRPHALPEMPKQIESMHSLKKHAINKACTEIIDLTENNKSASTDDDSAFFETENVNNRDAKISQISPHSCQYCNKKFSLLIALRKHEKKHKAFVKANGSTSMVAPHKNYEQEMTALKAEVTTIPIKMKKLENTFYLCPFCDETFAKFELYDLHVKTHNDGCQARVNQGDVLTKDEPNQIIAKLKPNIREVSDVDVQVNRKNKRNKNPQKSVICPVCQIGKTTVRHLLTHMASSHYRKEMYLHYDKTQRQCRICGKQFKAHTHLVSHLVTSHQFLAKILPLSPMKKRSTTKKIGLKNNNKKPFLIKEKKRQMADTDQLKEENDEQNEVPALTLQQHNIMSDSTLKEQQNYSKLTIKQENICSFNEKMRETNFAQGQSVEKNNYLANDKVMKISENLAQSVRPISKPDPSSTKSKRKRPFKCPICKAIKTSYSHLRVHIGTSHYKEKIRQFYDKTSTECLICEKKFNKTPHVESHLINKHRVLTEIVSPELLKKLEEISSKKSS